MLKAAHDQNEVLFDGAGNLAIGPKFSGTYLLQLYRFAK